MNVGAFLIGLPLNMDGTEVHAASHPLSLGTDLAIDLPTAFFDERMSTLAVERAMIDADCHGETRGTIDQLPPPTSCKRLIQPD